MVFFKASRCVRSGGRLEPRRIKKRRITCAACADQPFRAAHCSMCGGRLEAERPGVLRFVCSGCCRAPEVPPASEWLVPEPDLLSPLPRDIWDRVLRFSVPGSGGVRPVSHGRVRTELERFPLGAGRYLAVVALIQRAEALEGGVQGRSAAAAARDDVAALRLACACYYPQHLPALVAGLLHAFGRASLPVDAPFPPLAVGLAVSRASAIPIF